MKPYRIPYVAVLLQKIVMPEEWSFCQTIPPELEGLRVDAGLAKLYPNYSRNQWIEWLKQGKIHTHGKILSPKNKVQVGQMIEGTVIINTPQSDHLAQAIPLNIIYEDDAIVIIDKPAGLVVHPGAGQSQSTLLNGLLHHDPQLNAIPRAGIVHRLDKDTTGLMVVAKTITAYLQLIAMMQARQIERHYLALVHGIVPLGGKISTFFGRHPQNRLKMAVRPQGKLATTHYKVKQQFKQNTLLDIQLETGRTHQIRVHLSHIGHPIVGDKLYGKTRAPGHGPLPQILNAFPRQALHAYELHFIHPITNKSLTFTSNIPDDFSSLLKNL